MAEAIDDGSAAANALIETKTKDNMAERAAFSVGGRPGRLLAALCGDSLGAVLARGTGGSFVVSGLGQGLQLGLQILLARVMGAEDYGIYIYALTWINILILPAKLGLDTALLRYVAAYNARQEWGLLRGVWQTSNRLALVASVAVGSFTAMVVWAMQPRLGPELTVTLWVGCATLPWLALAGLRQAALQSLKNIVRAQSPDMILRPVLLAGFMGVTCILLSQPLDGPLAMGLNLLTVIVSLAIGTVWLRQKWPSPAHVSTPHYRNREWINVTMPLLLTSGLFLLLNRTDILLAGLLLGTTEAGIYAVASRVAQLLLFSLIAASTIAAPMISELYSQGRQAELQRLVTLTVWAGLAFSLPVSLGLLIWGRPVLALFGPAFAAGYPVLIILVIGQLVNCMTGPVGFMMTMTGHQNHYVLILTIALLIDAALNFLLIPGLGIVGAALATALINIGWNIAATLFVYRRLRIDCSLLAILRGRSIFHAEGGA